MNRKTLALIALCSLAGCNGPGYNGFRQVASTLEVGAGSFDGSTNDALGSPYASDSTAVWLTIRPLAFWEPPRQVVVVKGK